MRLLYSVSLISHNNSAPVKRVTTNARRVSPELLPLTHARINSPQVVQFVRVARARVCFDSRVRAVRVSAAVETPFMCVRRAAAAAAAATKHHSIKSRACVARRLNDRFHLICPSSWSVRRVVGGRCASATNLSSHVR